MADFDVEFPEDYMSGLLDSDFDRIAQKALEETAPMMESAMKAYCQRAIKHDGDSELVESICSRKPKKTKTDAWIVNIGPSGYSTMKIYYRKAKSGKRCRKETVSNALKAIWKEYGIAGQQAPRPFMTAATNSVRTIIMEKMQEVYDKEVLE